MFKTHEKRVFPVSGRPAQKKVPTAAASFIAKVKSTRPTWKGMCSVTAVGVEELVDERLLTGNQSLPDWAAAAQALDLALEC